MADHDSLKTLLNAVGRKLIDPGVASFFDPNPVRFLPQHEEGVRPLRQVLRLGKPGVQRLRNRLSRNQFLCGCLDFTENERVEHLIVGFGRKAGAGTWVESVWHERGEVSRVAVTSDAVAAILKQVTSSSSGEVLIFHNHPRHFLQDLLDNIPIASSGDRCQVLALKYFQPNVALKSLLGKGSILFFLGENGYVRKYAIPGVFQLLELLNPEDKRPSSP